MQSHEQWWAQVTPTATCCPESLGLPHDPRKRAKAANPLQRPKTKSTKYLTRQINRSQEYQA